MPTTCFAAIYHRPDKARPTVILHHTSRAAHLTLTHLIQRTAREYGSPIYIPRGFSYKKTLAMAHAATGEERLSADVIHVELSDIVVRWLKGVLNRPIRLAENQNWPMVPEENHPLIYDEVMAAPRLKVAVTGADRFHKRREEGKSGAWRIR